MVLTISPSFMGRRVGLALLGELVEHIRTFEGVWFGTCGALADWARGNDIWSEEGAR